MNTCIHCGGELDHAPEPHYGVYYKCTKCSVMTPVREPPEPFPLTDIGQLEKGALVRHKTGGEVWTVTGNYGGRATAAATMDITNPDEWEIIKT